MSEEKRLEISQIKTIFNLTAMIIGIGVMWGTLQGKLNASEQKDDEQDRAIEKINDNIEKINNNQDNIEKNISELAADVKIISNDLIYIREWIKEIREERQK